jgi:hypothetical protein
LLLFDQDGHMTLGAERNSRRVAGVFSTRPSLVGDAYQVPGDVQSKDGPQRIAVAMAGVVPVNACAENGAIVPGDLLTSGSTLGHAMRSDRYLPGTIVGKAMQRLDQGCAQIQMLVSLQ